MSLIVLQELKNANTPFFPFLISETIQFDLELSQNSLFFFTSIGHHNRQVNNFPARKDIRFNMILE